MSNFYTLLTNIGAALHANAQVQQTTVAWSHFALGDGNGAAVVPAQAQTGLRREVHRLGITSIETHPDNPNWIVVEAVVPSDVGGWTVRESAIYGGPGGNTCIAVGNYPETYKPVLAEGAGREMVMRMIVEISSVATVKLLIDPAVAIASRAWVQSLVASPQKAGLVKLATVDESKEGLRDDVAVTPEGLDAALEGIGGLPRFTPYVWGGRGDAMPEGDAQSSGQQLPDLMYPTMRADVLATQFHCPEEDWQANPMKRLTHWSEGEQGWMRPPDKNCVQTGSVEGGFYGSGVGSSNPLLGTAVLDQMQGFSVESTWGPSASNVPQQSGGEQFEVTEAEILKSRIVSNGIHGVPRFGEMTRPRTWYGIWMIRMYGRITNPDALNAPALNARMDVIDGRVATLEALPQRVSALEGLPARVAALEAIPKGLGVNQSYVTFTSSERPVNTWFPNETLQPKAVSAVRAPFTVTGNSTWQLEVRQGSIVKIISSFGAGGPTGVQHTLQAVVPVGCSYRLVFTAGSTDYTVQEITT